MSQFDPPRSPFEYGPGQSAFDAEMLPAGPAPMSGMAVAGFVSSVIICCPVLSPLLGLIFSSIGLVQTRAGLRRGRGLAIAGLILSLLVDMPLNGFGGYLAYNCARSYMQLNQTLITADGRNLENLAGPMHEFGSPAFVSRVTTASLTTWLRARFSSLGGLQSIAINQQAPLTPDTSGPLKYTMQFVASCSAKKVPFHLKVSIDPTGGRFSIDDIIVDDASVIEMESGGSAAVSVPQSTQPSPANAKRSDGL